MVKYKKYEFHQVIYSKKFIKSQLENNGFKLIKFDYFPQKKTPQKVARRASRADLLRSLCNGESSTLHAAAAASRGPGRRHNV